MTLDDANVIVGTYAAMMKVNGKDYADKHYLAKGTERYSANLKLLQEARRVKLREMRRRTREDG